MKSLALLLPSGRRQARRLSLSVLLGACTVGASVGLLATSGYLVSKAALRPEILTLTVAIVGVRFFGIVRAICRYLERLTSHDVTFRLLAAVRGRVYERLVPLAPAGLARLTGGDVLSRFVADVDSLQHVVLRVLAPVLVAVVAIVLAVGLAGTILWQAALALLLALVVAATAIPLVAACAVRSTARRASAAQAELTSELVELLGGAPELVAFGAGAASRERVAAAERRLLRIARRDAFVAGLSGGLATLAAAGAVVAVLVAGAAAVAAGRLDGVYLAVLVFLALASFEAVAPLPAAAQHAVGAAGVAQRLDEVTAAAAPVVEPGSPRRVGRGVAVAIEGGRFRYERTGPWVLDGIDLRLAPGRRVALVGRSGAGKSTVARVLVRFCDLDEGRATLDGHDLREYAGADVRREILLSSQDAHVFATSIRENVRVANPAAGDGDVARALERAGAWSWVSSLPDGLDTFVGEDGVLVSGGQRQRIALARILLSDAGIVVLDEPTAHLDPASATTFVEDLLAATPDRGLLLITHRLDALADFDEIVVLDAGRVVERGTERELLARGGAYAALAA